MGSDVQTEYRLGLRGKLAFISGLTLAGTMVPAAAPATAPIARAAAPAPVMLSNVGPVVGPQAPTELLEPAPYPHIDILPLIDVAPPPPPAPPAPPAPVVLGAPPCAFGSGSSLGLTANADSAYRAVCAAFPGVGPFGGMRAGDAGDHGSGNAVDIMCDTGNGDAIADFLLAHAAEFNINYVIWKQRIAYPGGGWSFMEDRGSATANHYDHVHVSVY